MLCQVCQAEIPAAHINLEQMAAKCSTCNAVFNFTKADLARTPAALHGQRVPRPESIVLIETIDRRELSFRWFNVTYVFMAFFCIAWDSFLFSWYSIALQSKTIPWVMIIFPVAHVAVGIGLTYSTLAGFFNRTVLRLEGDRLTVRHGPLPWRGNRELPSMLIDQIAYDAQVSTDNRGRSVRSHALSVIRKDGTQVPLLSGKGDRVQQLYIKQQLEHWLKLKPRPSSGSAGQ